MTHLPPTLSALLIILAIVATAINILILINRRRRVASPKNHLQRNPGQARFYHWWLYRLFFRFWTPILIKNPQMVRAMYKQMGDWLDQNARPKALDEQLNNQKNKQE